MVYHESASGRGRRRGTLWSRLLFMVADPPRGEEGWWGGVGGGRWVGNSPGGGEVTPRPLWLRPTAGKYFFDPIFFGGVYRRPPL